MKASETIQIFPSRLDLEPLPIEGFLPSEQLAVEDDSSIKPSGPIEYRLNAQLLGSEILIQGEVEAEVELSCARCTEFYSTKLGDSVFVRCFELSEVEDGFDLADDVREAVLLEIPSFPLCSEDCKGFCSKCKQNLNIGSCDCVVDKGDDRWSQLDEFKI